MINKILVPLDGSELAERALPYAREVARRSNAEILLLTSILPVGIWDATASAINWEREEQLAQKYLDDHSRRLQGDGLRARVKRLHGDPAAAVLHTAGQEGIDLIAMSSHGRSGITRWLFGSVADRIIQSSSVPLLVIRPDDDAPAASPAFAKILVPLDGSAVAARVLPFVEEIAHLFGASLLLFHAVAPVSAYPGFETVNPQIGGQALEEMQARARELLSGTGQELQARGLKVSVAISIDLAADGILAAARETGADLIAIDTHGRSGLGRIVLGSVANAVVRRSTLPSLIVRSPAAAD